MIPRREPSHRRRIPHPPSVLLSTLIIFLCGIANPQTDSLQQKEPIIRVNLAENIEEFSLSVEGSYNLKYQNFTIAGVTDTSISFSFSENGVPVATLPNQKLRFLFPIRLEPADSLPGSSRDSMNTGIKFSSQSAIIKSGQTYPGTVDIFPEKNRTFQIVNCLPLETYLRGVVPNELVNNPTSDEFQACMAQAIAARNYAFFRMKKPDSSDFDVYSDTRDQVYSGIEKHRSISDSATKLTSGMIVEFDGEPARCFFHSACGGRTESVQNIWQGQPALPYLQGVPDVDSATGDPYCILSPDFFWTRNYSASQLNSAVEQNIAVANPTYISETLSSAVADIKIVDRFESSRVDTLKIMMRNGKVYYVRGDRTRYLFRSANGTPLRSSFFRISISRDSRGRLVELVLKGQGSGHGVGMCQWGAIGMSKLGYSYLQILSHYFPGTVVKKVY
jgi:SpoIID/LytB domain protein